MLKKLLQKLVSRIVVGPTFKYKGYIDYPGVGIIRDSTVYNLIKDHSRLIDRMNPAKMTEMSLLGQCILMGIFPNVNPDDYSWQFYGKRSLDNLKDWG